MPQSVIFRDVHRVVKALKSHPTFAPAAIICSLEAGLLNAVRDSFCSIQDMYYEHYPLPLWVLKLWPRLIEAHDIHAGWLAIEEFINSSCHQNQDIHLHIRGHTYILCRILQQFSWNEPVLGCPALGWRPNPDLLTADNLAAEGSRNCSTWVFVQFFCNGFLNNKAINLMLHDIDIEVQRTGGSLANEIVIANLAFRNWLLLEYPSSYTKPAAPGMLLLRYGELIITLSQNHLYFVVNSGGNHWEVFKVNVVEKTIAYGDYLAEYWHMHQVAFAVLNLWLKYLFGRSTRFTQVSNVLCGPQSNDFSCGIAACATITSSIDKHNQQFNKTEKPHKSSQSSRSGA
ncbi:hypothetical protein FRC12_008029 [Ceratobasidium sp. 428]|nr:hypothetical protein FRC12_008029 [Ceratobasidium sp. 428]